MKMDAERLSIMSNPLVLTGGTRLSNLTHKFVQSCVRMWPLKTEKVETKREREKGPIWERGLLIGLFAGCKSNPPQVAVSSGPPLSLRPFPTDIFWGLAKH